MVSNRPPSVDARNTRKVVVFALVCVATLTAVALYAWTTRARRHLPDTKAVAPPLDPARLAELRREPHILFRITADTAFYGHVGVVAASAPASAPLVTTLTCDRFHASATRG